MATGRCSLNEIPNKILNMILGIINTLIAGFVLYLSIIGANLQ